MNVKDVQKMVDGLKSKKNISDGHHTFKELYDFRMLYNANLFKQWHIRGLYDVHKSIRHHDYEPCFGGEYFIVCAETPFGQITNHYKLKYWDVFDIPDEYRAKYPYDGHTPKDVLNTLMKLL